MADTTLAGDPPIALTLRRSGTARRMTLRVSRLDGRVTLSLPAGVAEREALRFARDKEPWLRRALAECAPPLVPAPGAELPLRGRTWPLVAGAGRAARLGSGAIELPAERQGPALASLLRFLAREPAERAVARHAAALGRQPARLSLRDTRSRWGSCSHDGKVMLCWRLVMAPPEVLDYVAAHEVAHLERMDHSAAFWRIVARLYPDYAAPRDWLRRHGADLHRWRFDAADGGGSAAC